MSRRTEVPAHYMLVEWAQAVKLGVFQALGWRGGVMSDEPVSKSQGLSKSNAAQVAALESMRREGWDRAATVNSSMILAYRQSPYQVGLLQYRYLWPGSWQEQAQRLGIEKHAYESHVNSALYLVNSGLIQIRDRDEREKKRA